MFACIGLTHFVTALVSLQRTCHRISPGTSPAFPLFSYGPVAHGIIAIGGRATGFIALGGIAVGVLAFGGIAVGAVAFSGLSVGLFALGGIALGWRASERWPPAMPPLGRWPLHDMPLLATALPTDRLKPVVARENI